MSKKTKKTKKTRWEKIHKKRGAVSIDSVHERFAHGCDLSIVPVRWTSPDGEASWTVSCAGNQRRGRSWNVKAAKAAAMIVAKKLESELAPKKAKKAKKARKAEPKATRSKRAESKKARRSGKKSKPRRLWSISPYEIARDERIARRIADDAHVQDLARRREAIMAGLPARPQSESGVEGEIESVVHG